MQWTGFYSLLFLYYFMYLLQAFCGSISKLWSLLNRDESQDATLQFPSLTKPPLLPFFPFSSNSFPNLKNPLPGYFHSILTFLPQIILQCPTRKTNGFVRGRRKPQLDLCVEKPHFQQSTNPIPQIQVLAWKGKERINVFIILQDTSLFRSPS